MREKKETPRMCGEKVESYEEICDVSGITQSGYGKRRLGGDSRGSAEQVG